MAIKLAEYLQGLKVRVNVIAFNQSDALPYASPTPAQVKSFCTLLAENHLFVRTRQSLGQDICAACGQLRGSLGIQRSALDQS
jgi:23S rRNA (adenine2503-C2)-methyltransferase